MGMKYSVRQYASAFADLLIEKKAGAREQLISGLLATLRRNGDGARLAPIIREVEREYYKRKKLHTLEVESVDALSKKARKEILDAIPESIITKESHHAGLIGGVRVLVDNEILIDATIQRQLKKMFTH